MNEERDEFLESLIDKTPVEVVPVVEEAPVVVEQETPVVVEAQAQEAPAVEQEYKWESDIAKTLYENLTSGNIDEVSRITTEQSLLNRVGNLSDEDRILMKMGYDHPELSKQEILDEFNAKYGVEQDDVDEDLLTDSELKTRNKQIDKQKKQIERELKKDAASALDYLSSLKKDISFPNLLEAVKKSPEQNDAMINSYMESQAKVYEENATKERSVFLNSIENGLNEFNGWDASYKDSEVEVSAKFSIPQEDREALKASLNTFTIDEFFGNRYFKEGKYNTKQLADDIYLLTNKDRVMSSMLSQAVSATKQALVKGIKNIDYNSAVRSASQVNGQTEYDKAMEMLYS